jgi:hypothetical protein
MGHQTPTRIIIVGCGKAKQRTNDLVTARSLYTGSIFNARRTYAEATGDQWYIASAQLGLLSPDQYISTYDKTLVGAPAGERALWSLRVVESLLVKLKYGDAQGTGHKGAAFKDILIELHMGEPYAEYLTQIIPAIGMNCNWATKGLSQGAQMAWYKQKKLLAKIVNR